jgi:tetratricopeptide (TPR) repeat protein
LAAEKEFKRAIELNPGYPSVHRWYGRYLTTLARFSEAIAELRSAQQLDPLSPSINAELSRPYLYTRQYDQAIAHLQETLELEPNFWPAHLFLGWAYEQKGQYTEAIAILSHASALDDNPRTLASLGHAYAVAGHRRPARKVLHELVEQSKQRYVSPYYIAGIHTGLGEKDLAFEWLERAYQDRSEWLVGLKVDPRFDNLRLDSRFTGLLRRVRLAPSVGQVA